MSNHVISLDDINISSDNNQKPKQRPTSPNPHLSAKSQKLIGGVSSLRNKYSPDSFMNSVIELTKKLSSLSEINIHVNLSSDNCSRKRRKIKKSLELLSQKKKEPNE